MKKLRRGRRMQDVVGFIPAAGVGSRMNGFPILKEMIPILIVIGLISNYLGILG